MTTNLTITTNGAYVADVTVDNGALGTDTFSVGPGSMVTRTVPIPHQQPVDGVLPPSTVTITERDATVDESNAAADQLEKANAAARLAVAQAEAAALAAEQAGQ